MSSFRFRALVTGALTIAIVAVGCGARTVSLTDAARAIRTGTDDPAAGLTEIGPIEVTHGYGCGGFGYLGNYEAAYNMLRNRAAEIGATYVKVTEQVSPHNSGDCRHNEFTIRALAYSGTPTQTAGGESAADGSGCSPPCSPGYACEALTCVALCNPPCSPGFACAQDRTCQAALP